MNEELIKKAPESVALFEKYNYCPKCSSLLVTDISCDLCDYQFNLHQKRIGIHPFGIKSFYFLRDEFEMNTSFFQRNIYLSKLFPKMKRRYLRHLVKRYEALLSHIMNTVDNGKKVYLVETETIINEYLHYDGHREVLKQKLRTYADRKEYDLFLNYIDFNHFEKEKRPFNFMALLLSLFFMSLITILALTFYSDFLVR